MTTEIAIYLVKSEADVLHEAHNLGRKAYRRGLHLIDNPYIFHDVLNTRIRWEEFDTVCTNSSAWNEGFYAASEEN
jgi:hypothetical protein